MSTRLRLLNALESRAFHPGDSPEERLRKNLLIFASALMSFGVMVWLAIYWAMGLRFSTTVPLTYQVVSACSIAWFFATGNFPVFRAIQLVLFLFFPFIMQWSIGSYVSSSGVVLWALLAPVGAVVFHGWRESIPWFIAYLLLTLLSGFMDYYLAVGAEAGVPMRAVAIFFGLNFAAMSTILYLLINYFVEQQSGIKEALDREHLLLEQEQARSERLLLNVLPGHIAQRLKRGEATIADEHDDVTVMFVDIVDFTHLTESMPPEKMVELLNRAFSAFDALSERHGLDKIKTVGDAYMVAGGLRGESSHAAAVAEMALEMREAVAADPVLKGHDLAVHIGIASGPVAAGVIGTKRFAYDLWGDTVNVASRLTTEGRRGIITVDANTRAKLAGAYRLDGPMEISVKGKGRMAVYQLAGRAGAAPPGAATAA